ncbi:MAG: hypothetical protein V1928_02545 [Parcubacteria group bacterium]
MKIQKQALSLKELRALEKNFNVYLGRPANPHGSSQQFGLYNDAGKYMGDIFAADSPGSFETAKFLQLQFTSEELKRKIVRVCNMFSKRENEQLSLMQIRELERELGVYLCEPYLGSKTPNEQYGVHDEDEIYVGDIVAENLNFTLDELRVKINQLFKDAVKDDSPSF